MVGGVHVHVGPKVSLKRPSLDSAGCSASEPQGSACDYVSKCWDCNHTPPNPPLGTMGTHVCHGVHVGVREQLVSLYLCVCSKGQTQAPYLHGKLFIVLRIKPRAFLALTGFVGKKQFFLYLFLCIFRSLPELNE